VSDHHPWVIVPVLEGNVGKCRCADGENDGCEDAEDYGDRLGTHLDGG